MNLNKKEENYNFRTTAREQQQDDTVHNKMIQYVILFFFVFLSNFSSWDSPSPHLPPSRGPRSLGVVQRPMSLMYIFMSVFISSAPGVFGFQRLRQQAGGVARRHYKS
jgi:hypothetical protein